MVLRYRYAPASEARRTSVAHLRAFAKILRLPPPLNLPISHCGVPIRRRRRVPLWNGCFNSELASKWYWVQNEMRFEPPSAAVSTNCSGATSYNLLRLFALSGPLVVRDCRHKLQISVYAGDWHRGCIQPPRSRPSDVVVAGAHSTFERRSEEEDQEVSNRRTPRAMESLRGWGE